MQEAQSGLSGVLENAEGLLLQMPDLAAGQLIGRYHTPVPSALTFNRSALAGATATKHLF